ncbi:unnamed protein product, partial [Mesorhabditis belari]|uniref:Uncharacterized protein n=1 Tax=Mesorhabditis belari TaxID=2138241 RepID=A0AAF3FDA2_9BILA
MNNAEGEEICRVCRTAPGRHRYGSWACDSCKIFFLRAATRLVPYSCRNENKCKQRSCSSPNKSAPDVDTNCALKAGLIPEIAGRRSGCLRRQKNEAKMIEDSMKPKSKWKRKVESTSLASTSKVIEVKAAVEEPIIEPELPLSPEVHYIKEEIDDVYDVQPPFSPPNSVDFQQKPLPLPLPPPSQYQQVVPYIDKLRLPYESFPQSFPLTLTNVSLPQLLASMRYHESYCNGLERPSEPVCVNLPYNFDLHLADVLNNPVALCPRVPIDFSPNASLPKYPADLHSQLFSRMVLHMVDWFRSLPEIWSLSPQDRTRLCTRQLLALYPVLILFNTYIEKSDALLLGLGASWQNDTDGFKAIRDFLAGCYQVAHRMVLPTFKAMNFTLEEYLLFKNIVIFHSTLGLSDQGAEIVRKARVKYEYLLTQHLTNEYGDREKALQKVVKIMELLNLFVDFGHRHNLYFSQLIALNKSQMTGKLVDEVYVKSDVF